MNQPTKNMTRKHLPSEIFIPIAGHLEPETCYSFIQGIDGLDEILPAKEFRRKATRSGNTIIHLAAQRGDQRLIESLHSRGLDVNLKNRHGVTPLAAASRRGHRPLVELLISTGATIDSQDKRGLTPLHNAAYHGADCIVQILLDAGADPFLEAKYPLSSALHWAAKSGHVSTVALLLNCLKNPGEIPTVWESALEIAAKKGRTAVVQLLIDAKFVISDGALHQAGVSGQAKTMNLLLSHKKDFGERFKDHLYTALGQGYSSTVKVMIEHDQSIVNPDPLVARSVGGSGSIKTLRVLLQAGVNFSRFKHSKWLLLSLAARNGKTAMVEYLARLGWVTPDMGTDGLFRAISHGHSAVVKILLDNGFKFDPNQEKRAISDASDAGHLEVLNLFPGSVAPILVLYPAVCKRQINLVQKILSSGLDTSSSDFMHQRKLRTSLWRAVENGDTEMVRLLLDAGVYPETKGCGEFEPSALYRAAKMGFLDIVKLLVQAGADICRENNMVRSKVVDGYHGYTALYVATTYRHQAVMKYLIQSGASVSFQGGEGHTALHAAARSSCPSSVTLLLKAGADVSAEAFCGGTPLHCAAQYGRLQAAELLLRAGADPSVRNRRGWSAQGLAMEYGHEEIATVLKEATN